MLYCSKSKPEDVIKTYCISAFVGIVLVIAAWFIGAIPSEVRGGRACLGFYFATFGPNLFLHTVLAYIASRKNGSMMKIMTRAAVLVPITPLSMKKSGTLMSAPLPKQTICRFVRLKKTFVLTAERSFGTGIYATKPPL